MNIVLRSDPVLQSNDAIQSTNQQPALGHMISVSPAPVSPSDVKRQSIQELVTNYQERVIEVSEDLKYNTVKRYALAPSEEWI